MLGHLKPNYAVYDLKVEPFAHAAVADDDSFVAALDCGNDRIFAVLVMSLNYLDGLVPRTETDVPYSANDPEM